MIVLQMADAHTWSQPYRFKDDAELQAFLKAYRDDFFRKRMTLPVRDFDYRVMTDDEYISATKSGTIFDPSPLAIRQQWVMDVLEDCRDAMDAPTLGFCLQSVPARIRTMHDAMRRILEISQDSQETGRAPRQALAIIEGIAHHAMARGYEPPSEGMTEWLRQVEASSVEDMLPVNVTTLPVQQNA